VDRFRRYGNAEFEPLRGHYKSVCRNWYTHLAKYMRIDRDEFENEFNTLLFRSMLRFDSTREDNPEEPVTSKFDRYFLAAVRKMSLTIRRRQRARKNSVQPLSITEHRIDLPDARAEAATEMVDVMDVVSRLPDERDRSVVEMRLDGCDRKDVCTSLGMPLHEYRARIGRLRGVRAIVSMMAND
jgi:DNA-directed RNA polymerase specialized sigma24 family protein